MSVEGKNMAHTMEHVAAFPAYEALPLFTEYLAARAIWQEAHAKYSAMCAFHRNKMTARAAMLEAGRKRDVLLAKLRETPEHLAAFGW